MCDVPHAESIETQTLNKAIEEQVISAENLPVWTADVVFISDWTKFAGIQVGFK